MVNLTVQQLSSLVAPSGNRAIIENTVTAFNQYADQYGLNTPLRKAHFLAQIAHESDHFNTTKEYGGSSTRYAPWYGRGLIQLTWQANYKLFSDWCQNNGLTDAPDFTDDDGREQASRFPWAFVSAIWYWNTHNLNAKADNDDVRGITKAINGGYNGLNERIAYLNKAKSIFGVDGAAPASSGYTVLDVQNALIKAGIQVDNDGVNGPATRAAVQQFQQANGLTPDGIMGPMTAAKLGL